MTLNSVAVLFCKSFMFGQTYSGDTLRATFRNKESSFVFQGQSNRCHYLIHHFVTRMEPQRSSAETQQSNRLHPQEENQLSKKKKSKMVRLGGSE